MFGGQELERLRLLKRALIVESDLNRFALRTECQNLQSVVTGWRDCLAPVRKLRSVLLVLAPLAGFLAVRGFRRADSGFGRVLALVRWVPRLLALWESFSAGFKKTGGGEPTAS